MTPNSTAGGAKDDPPVERRFHREENVTDISGCKEQIQPVPKDRIRIEPNRLRWLVPSSINRDPSASRDPCGSSFLLVYALGLASPDASLQA
jgi:hypothetical protein